METLCKIRDLYRSIAEFEAQFQKTFALCLNEGMLLCSLSQQHLLSSGEIADCLNLTPSNTSKIIKSVENKFLIKRVLGEKDKRQMYFTLTNEGKVLLQKIKSSDLVLPKTLQTACQ